MNGTAEKLGEYRVRSAAAAAEREELELARIRGEVVEAKVVDKRTFDRARAARDVLLGLPDRAAPRCVGKNQSEIHRILREEVMRVCDEIARRR